MLLWCCVSHGTATFYETGYQRAKDDIGLDMTLLDELSSEHMTTKFLRYLLEGISASSLTHQLAIVPADSRGVS
jgi:hypothetical protein